MIAVIKRVWPQDLASRAAALSVASNAVFMVIKLTVGVVSGSVAVLSDGIDSAEDLVASGIALAAVKYGARPADEGHPYGHGRAETIAATLQAVLIGIGGLLILARSVQRLVDPPDSIGTGLGIATMLLAAGVNFLLVTLYTGRVAKVTGSPAIASEARHLWTNVVQALAVTTGLVVVAITDVVELDSLIAMALGAYLLWTAGTILRSAASDVLDASLDDEELQLIGDAIMSQSGVIAFHELRTRRSGQSRHIDFHLVVEGDLSVTASHGIAENVQERIEEALPGSVVSVHIDPPDGRHPGAAL
jgi:cation diffusion facilitator family transporter